MTALGTRLALPDIDPQQPADRLVVLLVDKLDEAGVAGAFAWLHRESCQGHGLAGCTCVVRLIAYQTTLPQ